MNGYGFEKQGQLLSSCYCFSAVLSGHPYHLQGHGKHDTSQSDVESRIQFFVFLENDKRQYDTVYRFQVKAEIYGKGGYFLQGIHRQHVHANGAGPCQDEQVDTISKRGQECWLRKQVQVAGHEQGKAQETAAQLIKGNGAGIMFFDQSFIEYRKQCSKHGRNNTQYDSRTVLRVKVKDKEDTRQDECAEEQFYCIKLSPGDQGVKYGGKKAGQGKADDTDRYVGILNTAIEKDPVERYYHACAGNG